MKQLFIWTFYTHTLSTNPNFVKISLEYRKLEEVHAFVCADRPKLIKYISQLEMFLTIAPEEQMKAARSSETSGLIIRNGIITLTLPFERRYA
jgi:hypothetical protein